MLILASASPRRRELLSRMGLPFTTVVTDIDEQHLPGEGAHTYVRRLALDKARAGFSPGSVCIGSDTVVVIDEQILGKPKTDEDGLRMLALLAGRTHQVYTGVAVYNGETHHDCVVTTDVTFAELSDDDVAAYWATGEGRDKAGAYGIQAIGGILVKNIEGSFSAVMGLPVYETEMLLRNIGVDTWQLRSHG